MDKQKLVILKNGDKTTLQDVAIAAIPMYNLKPAANGQTYERPKLVLFHGGVRTACGSASSAVGPFYCPGDHKVYLDLDFFQTMQQRFD